jgi:PAS domain S-box-containing protein
MEWTEKGDPLLMFGTHTDITRLKKTQEALEQQKNALQQRNKEINCFFKMSEIVQSQEQTLEEMLQQFVSIIPPAFQNPLLTCAKITFKGKQYETKTFIETPVMLSSDIIFHGETAGSLKVYLKKQTNQEKTQSFLETEKRLIDSLSERIGRIAERKDSENKLSDNEKKFRMLFETMAQGVVYHDKTGKIIDANPATERILGLTLDQMQGLTSLDPGWKAIHEDGSPFPGEEHPAMVALRTGQPVHEKIMGVYHPKDQKHHWIKVNAIPQFHQGEDKPYQVYASFEDITEQKELEYTLREQREELMASNEEMEALNEELTASVEEARKANQAKSDFLANMSHELRTPLNGILGFGEILKNTPLSNDQLRYLAIILTSANNLLEIIRDILDFSRIKAQRFELHPEKTDLVTLIDKTASVVQYSAEKKGLNLFVDIAENVPQKVQVDGARLRQILLNLLSNAIKFTDEGEIHLTVKETERQKDKTRLLFQVTDTGIGIKEKDREMIFEPFRQVDMSNTREYGGTGLGLTIADDLLQKMGSSLDFKSRYGKGSTFYFELLLPCEKDRTTDFSKESSGEITDNPSFKNKKILIAEDNDVNMEYAKTALALFSKDLKILKAKNGKEAYQQYLEHNPDLILMDIVMPDKNGYQVTRMIRQHDTKIPIIAMTAKALKEDKDTCLAAGMNDYLTKPVALIQLLKTLKKYL